MLVREPEVVMKPKYQERMGEGGSCQLCYRHFGGPDPPSLIAFPLITAWVWVLMFPPWDWSYVTHRSLEQLWTPKMGQIPLPGVQAWGAGLQGLSSYVEPKQSQGDQEGEGSKESGQRKRLGKTRAREDPTPHATMCMSLHVIGAPWPLPLLHLHL